MTINIISEISTQHAIETHLLNPENTCLAFRDGQWSAIKRENAQIDEGFFQALFGPSSPIKMAEIESVELYFENKSLKHLDHSFTDIVEKIRSLSAHGFGRVGSDEGYDFGSSSMQLLDQLNLLKHLILENPTEDYTSNIQILRSEFNGIKRDDLRYGECNMLLDSIERMVNLRRQAEPAIPAPAAADAEAPVDEAHQMRRAKINGENESLRQQKRQNTLQQITKASNPLFQASTQFEQTVQSFRTFEKDPGVALEIFDETKDLANAVTAQKAYEIKDKSLRELVETLKTAIQEASAFKNQMLENLHEFSDDREVTQSINRLGWDIDALETKLNQLNTQYSTQVRETSSYTKIKERYEKRQEILRQATAALKAYTGPAPILISIENDQLKVEKKPFSVFGQPKGVELMTLPNGMTFAIKQQSKDDLNKLFKLAFSPVSRYNPVSTRFLEGHRQDFESALQRKLSK